MKQKIYKNVLSVVLSLVCAVASLGLPVIPVMAATGDVAINETNFKDAKFRDYVSKFDTDKNNVLSKAEREAVTEISLYSICGSVSDLSGINNFPNLIDLNVSYTTKIKSLDLSALTKIEVLSAEFTAIETVDLSKNTELVNINFYGSKGLSSIDVSNCSKLESLYLFQTAIDAVNVTNNPELQSLFIEYTDVSTIDISKNPNLRSLRIGCSKVYEVDISNNPYLLECYVGRTPETVDDQTEYYYKYGKDISKAFYINNGSKVITTKPVVTPTPTPTTPVVTPVPVTPATPAPETGLAGFIERLYNVALGRSSEAQGKEWWINKVKFENYTGSDVANGFLVSDEFLGKQMSNDQFLEVLYKTFFDRASDAQGKAYWLNLMANGYSKSDVINGFCNSTEWANLCLTYGIPSGSSASPTIVITPNEGTNAFVTRLYTTCLGRAPEQAGFEYWTYRLANMQERGSSAAYGFFTSPEFTGKGYDNATYVTLLYRTILGREPDQAGLNYWLNLMANGMNRVDVLNGFAASTEWADICSGYGILK